MRTTTHARECAAAPIARSVTGWTIHPARGGVNAGWLAGAKRAVLGVLRNRRARSYSLILAQIQPIFSRMIDVHAAFAPAVRPLPCAAAREAAPSERASCAVVWLRERCRLVLRGSSG